MTKKRYSIGAVAVAMIASLALGFWGGIMVGVSARTQQFLDGDEEPANVERSHRIEQPAYSLEYPRNWSLDPDLPSYDLDFYFLIKSPGGCYVLFYLPDSRSGTDAYLSESAERLRNDLSYVTEEAITTWGAFPAVGHSIRGRDLGIWRHVNVLRLDASAVEVGIVENCYEKDLSMVEPGFGLIRETFALREN